MSVSEANGTGREAVLRALIARLTAEFDACESLRDLKAISVEIREAYRELDELAPPVVEKPKTSLDEVRQRRESRLKKSG